MKDIEKTIIGMAINSGSNLQTLIDLDIKGDNFSDHNLSRAWTAIQAIHKGNVEVNLVTVSAREPDLAVCLIDCLQNMQVAVDVNHYGSELIKMAWINNATKSLGDLTARLLRSKVGDKIETLKIDLESTCNKISSLCREQTAKNLDTREVLSRYSDLLEKRIVDALEGKTRGITTGIKDLDKLIHGWMPGSLNILAARTSLGKTTLALNFANVAINAGKKTLFFTNEMPATQIMEKILSLRSGVFNHKLFSGILDQKQIDKVLDACEGMAEKHLWINQSSGRRLRSFLGEVRRAHHENGLDFVVLDYVQQMQLDEKSSQQNRTLEIAEITSAIKELSIDLNIAVVCIAQLNRQAENSNDEPNLANIRDSGAIEQDADTVIFIHRERERIDGQCDLLVAKNRFGPCGKLQVQTDLKVNKFF